MGPSHPSGSTEHEADPRPEATSRLDALARRVIDQFWAWGFGLLLVGLAPGLAAWPLAHRKQFDFILDNKLEQPLRLEILAWMAGSLVLVVAAYVSAWAILRRRNGSLSFGEMASKINFYSFFVISTPLLAVLRHKGLERHHYFVTILIIVVCVAFAGTLFYRLQDPVARWRDRLPRNEAVTRWLPLVVVGLLGVWYATRLSHLALVDHRNLGTHIWDLGIYDNLLYKTSHGEFLACVYCKGGQHTSGHFDPLLALLVPLYNLAPRAETLLIFQSCWLATGVIPMYLIGKYRLENPWYGVMLAAVYAMFPALHGVNMFDFHSLSLSIPTFLWTLYFLDTGARWRYWGMFVILLATREDMALLSCFMGVYAMTRGRATTGIITIAIALSYLTFVKLSVMPDSGLLMQSRKSSSFIYYYEEMIPYRDEGLKGLIISFFTNPAYVLQVLAKEQKVFFFLALLVPLLFLPLLGGSKRIIMAYGFVFIGMASRKYVYSIHFQYSSVLFPVMIASVPDAVHRVKNSRIVALLGLDPGKVARTLMLTSVFSTALTSSEYGVLVENDSFRAGWNQLIWTHEGGRAKRYAYLKRLVAEIEPDASVCTSNELGPHVSSRAEASMWPRCKNKDYILVHSKRFKKGAKRRIERLINRGEYRKIGEKHGLTLLQRVPDDERAAARKEARRREQERKKAEREQKKRERDKNKNEKGKKGKKEPAVEIEEPDRPDDDMDEAERFRSQVRGDKEEPELAPEGDDDGG